MSVDRPEKSCESKSGLSDIEVKALDLMTRGRSLNSGAKFNQEAFDLLSKAIKLNPYLIEAWIELTKCYQRKSDIEGAIACLENALKFSGTPNKIILRQLSTCIRQRSCNTQEAKVAALLRSLELSKQALRSDLYDEENYYNLAKAYMCLFFVTECVDQQLINLSKAAYSKALSLSNENSAKRRACDNETGADKTEQITDGLSKLDFEEESKPFIEQSDFLFNYSTVLVYFQEFDKALTYLRLAVKLDPDWTEPKALEETLVDYLKQVHSMLQEGKNPNKLAKKYHKITSTLSDVSKIESAILSDQQRLQKTQDILAKSYSLDQLPKASSISNDNGNPQTQSEKDNSKNLVKLLHLKLVGTINCNQAMYMTFIGIDSTYSLIVVTIYNLAATRCPGPKDVITFVNPTIEEIKVDLTESKGLSEKPPVQSHVIQYKRIDAREFKEFYVNGRRITIDQVSKPRFSISVLP